MCETMAIASSRPLTIDNIHDSESLEPLTPNHLLTMKSRVILPPPGNFQRTDLLKSDGEEFNTQQTSSGLVEKRNFLRHCKYAPNGCHLEEIYALEMLSSSRMITSLEMNGVQLVLLGRQQEMMDIVGLQRSSLDPRIQTVEANEPETYRHWRGQSMSSCC